jgi:hypothetical protein
MKTLIVVILLVVTPHQAHAGVIRFTAKHVFPKVASTVVRATKKAATVAVRVAY